MCKLDKPIVIRSKISAKTERKLQDKYTNLLQAYKSKETMDYFVKDAETNNHNIKLAMTAVKQKIDPNSNNFIYRMPLDTIITGPNYKHIPVVTLSISNFSKNPIINLINKLFKTKLYNSSDNILGIYSGTNWAKIK